MHKLAGRYRVGEVLGLGGNATVRYGFDTVLKRPVAIKMFDGSAAEVLREARTAAGLSHPNIAQVYDYGELVEGDERTPYLVMEFVGGETLADRLARTGALRWRRAAEIGAQTADALAAAHAQSLVHRDVHPRNVMLTPDGVKVLDFGIAAVAGQHGVDAGGALWGSPAYLAPEQLRGEPSFPAGDVYALGLLLFESLTGSRAWPGETIGAILATRHGRPAPRLPRLAGLPRELVRLYDACTSDDPTARPTAAVVGGTLRRVGYSAPLSRPAAQIRPVRVALTAPPSPSTRRRSRHRAAVMGSAAVVAAILSVVGVQLANGTVTPGGREAEAAVEGPEPVVSLSPAGSPSASPTDSARPRRHTETTTTTVRRKTAPPSTVSTTTPTSVPTSVPTTEPAAPTTKPAPPSSPPASSPRPQPTTPPSPSPDAPEPTDPTTEPTAPATTPPAATTPPTTSETEESAV